MTSRSALSPNTELHFGQETQYTIKGEVGRGGSCIVYDGAYRTNAGDEKTVRIKECFPFDLSLKRDESGRLLCPPEENGKFEAAKEQMTADFLLCNRLYYAEPSSGSIINTINIYKANNTIYIVSAWSREQVLSNVRLGSLRECFSIVRQTAFALQCIHQAGYLYLDIKPDNISIVDGITKRVQLFDFDSLLPISGLRHGGDQRGERLSYTRGFAALELRRGQIESLGCYTDVFGVGALLFYLLFGRTPEAPDCARGAVCDFSAMRFSRDLPDRLLIRLEYFFRKTLSSFPFDRWQRMESVVSDLEAIERLADPAHPYLISAPISAPACYIGRTAETETLNTWYENETQQTLFVTGMGGIGKSTFIRRFLAEHRREWDSVVFLYFNHSVRQTILSDETLRINGTERFPEEKEADYFDRKLARMHEIVQRDRVLLVIDNFEDEHDLDLSTLLDLGCKTILITRRTLGSLNLPVLNLKALSDPADLQKLFSHYLGRAVCEDESGIVEQIIRRLAGHTLAVELFARQIANSFLSLTEASELLEKQGLLHAASEKVDYQKDDRVTYERLEAIMTGLFRTDSLSLQQTSILKSAALFPSPGISPRELMRLSGIESPEPALQLVRFGWITRDNDRVFLHPLIRDVVIDLPGTDENLAGAEHILRTLCDDISGESRKEELYIRCPDECEAGSLNLLLCGSDKLPDPETIVTDHRKLDQAVRTARIVLDSLAAMPDLLNGEAYQKLCHAMVEALPIHEDDAILKYGMCLLEDPEFLSPSEVLDVYEAVNKVLLLRQEFELCIRLASQAKKYAVDDLTRAEHFMLLCDIYDTRDAPGDSDKELRCIESGIRFARSAPHPERKHLLAEFLLSKMNGITRGKYDRADELDGLIEEIRMLMETECLPWSEIRFGFPMAMAFYWSEVEQDREEADRWIAEARRVAAKIYPNGLDVIDNSLIPPAIMYIDMEDFDACESALREAIRICDEHADLIAYRIKKHDLQRYLLDVFIESEDYTGARGILKIVDEGCRQYGLPDTVQPEVRKFLAENFPE